MQASQPDYIMSHMIGMGSKRRQSGHSFLVVEDDLLIHGHAVVRIGNFLAEFVKGFDDGFSV